MVMQTGQMDSDAAIQVITKSERYFGKMNYKSKEKNMNQAANECRRCGRLHEFRQCPAFGVESQKCGRNNHHHAKMCMSRGLLKARPAARASRTVDNIENDIDIDMLHIGTILRIN